MVTGASSGLGAEFARQLAARGASRLILVARRRARLEALAASLSCETVVEELDLTDRAAVTGLIARHSPDILINNAGMGIIGPLLERPAELMVELNVVAPTRLIEGWLPAMVQRGHGGILNVGSTAGLVATPYMAAYSGTKAYVNVFSEGLRLELLGSGVRVTNLAPGPVATEFFEVAAPGAKSPPNWLMQKPETTVRAGLRGLERNRPTVMPGLIWLAMFWRKWTPEWVVRLFVRAYGHTLKVMSEAT